MERFDAAIIGGGAEGLTASIVLARAGLKTIVVERNREPGGRCQTREFHPGFRASPFCDEVPPIPADPDGDISGIRYRFGAFPVLEPATIRGFGYLRFRYKDPATEDNIWWYIPSARRVIRSRADAVLL